MTRGDVAGWRRAFRVVVEIDFTPITYIRYKSSTACPSLRHACKLLIYKFLSKSSKSSNTVYRSIDIYIYIVDIFGRLFGVIIDFQMGLFMSMDDLDNLDRNL